MGNLQEILRITYMTNHDIPLLLLLLKYLILIDILSNLNMYILISFIIILLTVPGAPFFFFFFFFFFYFFLNRLI